jgi:hypothetical protein
MRLWPVAAAITALGSCTLIEQPTSYFDQRQGQGTIVTLGTVTAQAIRGLALTTDAVIYATSDTVYRVPKSGGNVDIIAPVVGDDLMSVAGDGTNRVAWCSPSAGVTTWDDRTSMTTPVLNSEGCQSLAISENRLVYTIDTPTARYVSYQSNDGADSPDTGFVIDQGAIPTALALTGDDVYYATQGNALARELLASDDSGAKYGPVGGAGCYLATGATGPVTVLLANASDAEVALVISGTDVLYVTNTSTCCDRLVVDAGPNACPPVAHWVTAYTGRLALQPDSTTAWAIAETSMMHLDVTGLLEDSGSLSPLEEGSSKLTGTYSSPTNLAVDGTYAFFSNYNPSSRLVQVQRLQLTP